MSFQVFKTKYQQVISTKSIAVHVKADFGGSLPSYDDFTRNETQRLLELDDVLGLKTETEDYYWLRSGCPTIFVEDKNLINELYNAKYEPKHNALVSAPFPVFSFCFPSGLVVDGELIPPCLVSLNNGAFISEQMMKPFIAKFTDMDGEPNYPLDETYLSFGFRVKDGSYCNKTLSLNDALDIVNEKNELISFATTMYDQSLTDSENKTIRILNKLILGLLIYHSATEGKGLVKGFPKSTLKLPKNASRVSYDGCILGKADFPTSKSSDDPEPNYKILKRDAYYRNLQNERYYRGKHANTPRNSRWIYVRGFDRELDEYTQNKL
ncbi:hypothetical protein LMH73_007290 [Vibrio splendidus]|nr:hypothetical protein [Vibrio splendidus]MCC4880686.1 hypothetical protein [Vibrio splendidus]